MVVTFVIGSMEYICEELDRKRLNKQKVEANQILNAGLELTKGWVNHPAVLMWKGYSNALKYYFNQITNACVRRGFKNNMQLYEFTEEQLNNIKYQSVQDYLQNGIPIEASTDKIVFPWWFQWKPLIYSHQASLLRKDNKYYKMSFYMFDDYEFDHNELKEYLNTGYLWPHKLSKEQIENFNPSYCDEIGTGAPAIYRWTREEVEEWLDDMYTNPKTGRTIKPSKTGVYSDLKKAAKLYGYDISDDIDIKVNYLKSINVIKENKNIINNNNNMHENEENLVGTSIKNDLIENENVHYNETKIKLKQLLDSSRSNKIHTETIMTLSSLKDAHIYCKCNNLSGQFTGPVLEKYIKIKYNMTKNNASLCNGDLKYNEINVEIKASNGGKENNKFNFVQLRMNHACEYILTAYYIDYTNLNNLGELYIFKLNKENIKPLIVKYGGYAHGTIGELGEITIDDLNNIDNPKEYALRPKYGDKCWIELLNYRVNEIAI